MSIKKILHIRTIGPAYQLTALLLILTFIQAIYLGLLAGKKESLTFLLSACVLTTATVVLYFLFKSAFKKSGPVIHVVISGLILFLVLSHDSHNLSTALSLLLCLYISKYFLLKNSQPIFNPVAFSITLTTVFALFIPGINDPSLDWSGLNATFNWFGNDTALPLLVMGLSLILMAGKVSRYYLAFSFVATALLMNGLIDNNLSQPSYYLAVFFVGGFVIIEPRTSPAQEKLQLLQGVLAGVFVFVLEFNHVSSAVMIAIVVINIINALSIKVKSRD